MFSKQVCNAALSHLSAQEHQALQQEAARRGLAPREALMVIAMEHLQQQLYSLAAAGRRLELVKG